MAKKTTLNELAQLIEKGFAAVAGDVADLKRDMATKEQMTALHTQVNSIETQLRDTKIETRLGNLEDKVFGAEIQQGEQARPLTKT